MREIIDDEDSTLIAVLSLVLLAKYRRPVKSHWPRAVGDFRAPATA